MGIGSILNPVGKSRAKSLPLCFADCLVVVWCGYPAVVLYAKSLFEIEELLRVVELSLQLMRSEKASGLQRRRKLSLPMYCKG